MDSIVDIVVLGVDISVLVLNVLERRSVWWGPQRPSVGGGGARGEAREI